MVHYYAKLNNNIVRELRVVADAVIATGDGLDESLGSKLLADLHGGSANNYVRCSTMGEFRGKTIAVGFEYLPEEDIFRPVSPFPSWGFDEDSWFWVAPIPRPEKGDWQWDEQAGVWVEVEDEAG
jgi:hypothetical protein